MYTLTSGTYNTAVGWSAGALCATGQQNTIVGALAFDAADGSESYNTVIGYAAGGAVNHNSSTNNDTSQQDKEAGKDKKDGKAFKETKIGKGLGKIGKFIAFWKKDK